MKSTIEKVEQIPLVEHWAILEDSSYMESGYDPGDPGIKRNYVSYKAYLDKDLFEQDLKSAIERGLKSVWNTNVKGIHVQGVYSSKIEVLLTK